MAKKETTELAKPSSSSLPAAPSYIKEGNTGFENQQQGDLVFPRAVLMQALSPAVVEKQFESGDVVNSVTNERIAAPGQKRAVVPVMFWHEWIEWAPRADGGGMRDRSQDSNGELARRCKEGEKITNEQGREVPAVTEYLVFLVQPVDISDPLDGSQMFCVCCAKTNFKHGRKFLTLARMRGNKPLFAGVYNLFSTLEKNTKNQQYYVFSFTNAGWTPQEVYENLEEQYQHLKTATVSAAAPAKPDVDGNESGDAAAAEAEKEL